MQELCPHDSAGGAHTILPLQQCCMDGVVHLIAKYLTKILAGNSSGTFGGIPCKSYFCSPIEKCRFTCCSKGGLPDSIMVVRQILVLFVLVRIQVGQHDKIQRLVNATSRFFCIFPVIAPPWMASALTILYHPGIRHRHRQGFSVPCTPCDTC